MQTQDCMNEELVDSRQNIHRCPSCRMFSLKGMPGGRDAICKNCGFKEPCCGD